MVVAAAAAPPFRYPRFFLKAWDWDLLGGNDLIGAAEVPAVRELFLSGWKRFEEQQSRPEAVKKMGQVCVLYVLRHTPYACQCMLCTDT